MKPHSTTDKDVAHEPKIPKIIHYVWLGGGEKNETIKKCMRSWEKFCPGYQIIEWNEERIKGIDNQFLREAIESKYWAFASDYIRLYALLHFGGLYFDTDLEITSPVDEFLQHDFFCCFEPPGPYPSAALIGSKKGDALVSELLDYYRDRKFIIDGKPDLIPNPQIFKDIFSRQTVGIRDAKDSSTLLLNASRIIYPSYFFCRPKKEHKNFAIHHFNGSWLVLDKTFFRTVLKIGRLEIIKTNSQRDAPYPPQFDDSITVLVGLTYKNRKRIYLILR